MKPGAPYEPTDRPARPDLGEILFAFLAIGLQGFGTAIADVLVRSLCERRGWLTIATLRERMALVGLLPGPFHINLVMALGYGLGGWRGQLLAIIGFCLPSFVLACIVAAVISLPTVGAFLMAHPGVLTGMLAAIAALVLEAAFRLGRDLLGSMASLCVLLALVLSLLYLRLPPFAAIVGLGVLFAVRDALYRKTQSGGHGA